jgi:hypothetical protein
METLKRKLRQALIAEFPSAKVVLTQSKPSDRITGEIVWKGFAGVEHIDRQCRLRKVVDSALNGKSKGLVSLILTLTPQEDAVMSGSSED